jgi:hypothetical protein
MITQRESLSRLIGILERTGIPYMIAGSASSSLHGRPRATQDMDIVIDPDEVLLSRLTDSLEQGYYVSREAALDSLRHRTMFNVIDLDGGWKTDFIIRKDRPFSREEFQRRRRINVAGQTIWVVSAEDTILSKLEWTKDRQSDVQYSDALGVAVAQWETLDVEYLRHWAKQLGVEDSLTRLLNKAREQIERTGGVEER